VNSLLTNDKKIKTHGLGEMLVRRRLELLSALVDECGLQLKITQVPTDRNLADRLTRVPQKWLQQKVVAAVSESPGPSVDDLKAVHEWNHFGVNRTLYVAKNCHPTSNVTREQVEAVVRACHRCRSIDPAPVRWEAGNLEVEATWDRIACDVTHLGGKKYLTIIDCGPSRFAIWRLIPNEGSEHVTRVLSEAFAERGPPAELLLDNGTTFRSQELQALCSRWGVKIIYRCAYRPQGNGIVERNHRTIKRMVARTGGSAQEMTFWYNFAPKEGVNESTTPSASVFRYKWRNPKAQESASSLETTQRGGFQVGDRVYVKPNPSRCTTEWKIGRVSGVQSAQNVEVDGVPRHVADIRMVADSGPAENVGADNAEMPRAGRSVPAENVGADNAEMPRAGRSRRARRPPAWMNDFK
jgi:transposase InsO family protein